MLRAVLFVAVVTLALGDQRSVDYRKLAGRTMPLCGAVVSQSYSQVGGGCDVRLDLASPYWKPLAYVLVAEDVRARLTTEPDRHLSQTICATGLVQLDEERVPHVLVTTPDQIRIVDGPTLPAFAPGVRRACERGMTPPKLVKEVRPQYPSGAFTGSGTQDRLLIEAVVGVDGGVVDTRIIFSRSKTYIESAQSAVKKWRFKPAVFNGEAVPVVVQIEMEFTFG